MKVAVITTSRADWNALGMVALELKAQGGDVTVLRYAGSPHGDMISADGFGSIMFGSSVTTVTTNGVQLVTRDAAAMGELATRAAGRYDMAVVLGDRHEMLVAAFALVMVGIPVAHIAGGDVTGGSLDENWRHAISKMASIHFPTNEAAAKRLLAMGERVENVYMLGSPSVDRVLKAKLPIRATMLERLKLPAQTDRFILVNWQAEADGARGNGFGAVLEALRSPKFSAVPKAFIGQNADPSREKVEHAVLSAAAIDKPFARNTSYFGTVPSAVYLAALKHAAVLVGNSSSGFYEAPYFGTSVVNVGDRQRGRSPVPQCMRQVRAVALDVEQSVERALKQGRWFVEKPFGDGDSARLIARTILAHEGRVMEPKRFAAGGRA